MGHNRKFVLGAVSLTMARVNRKSLPVWEEIRDMLEEILIGNDFFVEAPFTWVGLMFRLGLKNETEPHYFKIDKKDGELPIAIELDTHEIRDANHDELMHLYSVVALRSLVHVAHKYDLPYAELELLLQKELNAEEQ